MSAKATTDATESPNAIQQLASDVTTLIQHEIELAKAELAEKVKSAGIGAGMLSASAVAGLLTLVSLTAFVAVLLALVIPPWAAVLAVTVLWGVVTVVLALLGKGKVDAAGPFLPERTIENLKKDMAQARRRVKP